ncbi:MAG: hypothetical protein PWP24_1529 [Clostridiales bacterium]|nr:hypothetical protein [Clostridiales bacterium]
MNNRMVLWMKHNIFLECILGIYAVIFFSYPKIGIQAIYNSGYYIKEMLMIMPVIFILTALLDSFVPKEMILRTLGKEAKLKGVFFSFLLGSISAGPIYAAFPICTMLHKKGATIRNLIIIISSWAVVKIPMLINEAKFLGLKFMLVRWGLTILSILLFSFLAGLIVKDDDLPREKEEQKIGVTINRTACMGCTVCTKKYPELFEMDGKKARVKEVKEVEMERLLETISSCPVKAIDNAVSSIQNTTVYIDQ